jgi:3',5'-cyclic AMP phosphodiesterase CpdA
MYKIKLQWVIITLVYTASSIFPRIVSGQILTDYPKTSFFVFSDPHYYNPSLGTEGEAFQEYLDNDRKLLKESPYILEEALKYINSTEAAFVIIPGDLTKDGTLVSHQAFAKNLSEIEKTGKKVFVVPGNHDILNPQSNSYKDSLKIKVENIDPLTFKSIYHNFGYGEAISTDFFSLSYVAEPVEGLWLIGMDACRYNENSNGYHAVTGGRFSESTLKWIEEQLNIANEQGKEVIGFMHHGILEHYDKQAKFYGEYVVEDYGKISKLFAEKGMKLVFTGHFHAQDIVKKDFGKGKVIYDIETGSLVTFPCPIRKVDLSAGNVTISTKRIDFIETHPNDFENFSKEYVWSGIEGIAKRALVSYKLSEDEAELLSGQVADAFIAHYYGDEAEKEKAFDLKGVSLKGRFLISFKKKLVLSLWHDLEPEDNNLEINF